MFNHGHEPFCVKVGMKIAQFILMPCGQENVTVVEELTVSGRGEDGFGPDGRHEVGTDGGRGSTGMETSQAGRH